MTQSENNSRNQEAMITALNDRNKEQEALARDQGAAIRNLEVQFGQLAKHQTERPTGKLPADTQEPRIENASAITTRSGKVLPRVEEPVIEEVVVEGEVRDDKKKEGERNIEGEKK